MERQVRVGSLSQADPRVVTLSFARAEPIVLLVIPPGTAGGRVIPHPAFPIGDFS
ncbi:hypothetical protein [Nonomuraea turkmeniaca]|uniref:hypothetical protein n=1 Tax=Nonomuraea turkmeniaca TaxID=103838 RepID=UPI00147715E4|nr:hypothetical protein [Nonomuraea turkmeniaca]